MTPPSPPRPNSRAIGKTMLIAQTLAGQRVLVVHEDPFQRSYLTEVLIAAGAAIAGAVATAEDGATLLAPDDVPDAIVLSLPRETDGTAGLTDRAIGHGIVILRVHPARAVAPSVGTGQCNLGTPYAGFQVVGALVRLLSATGDASSRAPGDRTDIP